LHLQVLQHALVGLDGGLEDVRLRFGIVEIGDRGRALADKVGIAAHVALGAFELRLVAGDLALGGGDLRLDGAAIEGEQELALFDMGAVAEVDGSDVCIDAGLQGDARDRRDGAERLELDGDLLAFRLGHLDRDCPLRGRTAGRASGGAVRRPNAAHEHGSTDQGEQSHPKEEFPSGHRLFLVQAI